jgi:hypothetical protein
MSFRQPPKQADSHTFLSSFWVLHTKGLPKVSAKEIELHKNMHTAHPYNYKDDQL